MRILSVHNYYAQPGGEDRVFESEASLLESHGHEVIRFVRHNSSLAGVSRAGVFMNALWSRKVASELTQVVADRKPDVAHVHNVFSVLSPVVYHVFRRAGIPVVQTLHNYRLACPAARLRRAGRFCDQCRGRMMAWPAIRHRCYQSSLSSSAALSAILAFHRLIGTWTRGVDLYIAPSEFLRKQMIPAGVPTGRVVVKPHYVPDPGGEAGRGQGGGALYLGRLEAEKGVLELLDAWRLLPGYPLDLVGEGPLESVIRGRLRDPALSHVSLSGWAAREDVDVRLAKARLVVVPSVGDESFGLPVIEAFSYGVPAIVSQAGALPELVTDGVNGVVADPGNALKWAAAVRCIFDDAGIRSRMSREARSTYLQRYSPDIGYRNLLAVYGQVRRMGRFPSEE